MVEEMDNRSFRLQSYNYIKKKKMTPSHFTHMHAITVADLV